MTTHDPMVGKTLGKYKIVERLGQGGMAEVYKAYQANLDRYVAVKFIKTTIAESLEYLARFSGKPRARRHCAIPISCRCMTMM